MDEPDLLSDVRRALVSGEPLDLLAVASSILAVVDPRGRNPFDGSTAAAPGPSREELVASFLDVELVETSALLALIAAIDGDKLLAARIARELARRAHPLPAWPASLGQATAYGATEMVHVLGDGDNVMVGVRLPGAGELSIVVYIDHNLGTLVKDAFVVPEPIGDLVRFTQSKSDDPDTTWNPLDPADARARIADAIKTGAMTFPPFETDTWPACRPLVEWVCRLLPEGGRPYDRPEWDDDALAALAEGFFASPFAVGLEHPDYRSLLEGAVLWFASGYGPGDPQRWSPTAVEILLADWIPRKVVADARYLTKAPALLRAFIRFCHAERGIRPALTNETLAAVDRFEPDYQRAIRLPRLQGPAALLAAVGVLDGDGLTLGDGEPWGFEESILDGLRRAVGGEEALAALDGRPLPDEPFSWDGIPADIEPRVGEVLALCDGACDALLDAEYRTAARRFLARAAAGNPDAFRRAGKAETAAAAVCWAVGKANELFRPSGGGMKVKDLAAHLGVTPSNVSYRAATLLRAGGFDTDAYDLHLGSPDFLVASRRRRLIERRDACVEDG